MATATINAVDVLNKQIANWSVLYIKLHNYHWFVQGNQFFTLHTKFEELYTEAAAYIDELAERVLTLKGRPLASMKEFLEQSSVKEAKNNENANQMVENCIDDFNVIINELKKGVQVAQDSNDETTADMLIGIQASLEKHVWMLSSFLG
jgi:starvation-inducible DNA-binding protein